MLALPVVLSFPCHSSQAGVLFFIIIETYTLLIQGNAFGNNHRVIVLSSPRKIETFDKCKYG